MATDDFFRARLEQMIDLRHPLAVLSQRLPWSQIEAALAPAFARGERAGQLRRTSICSEQQRRQSARESAPQGGHA